MVIECERYFECPQQGDDLSEGGCILVNDIRCYDAHGKHRHEKYQERISKGGAFKDGRTLFALR